MTGDMVLVPEGTYHIVSNYGDANSTVRSDIRVEVGKLTDTTVNHRAAIITLKLVNERGGEARANTQWSVLTPGGDVIKESIGAFPRVILAEGEYRVVASQRQQDLRGRIPGGQRRRPRGRGHRALKRRRRQARSKRAISIAPAYDACVAVRESRYASDSEHGLEDRPRPAARQHGCAAAAPLVPPSDQAGRERYRHAIAARPLHEPNPPAKPLLRWDCDERQRGAARRAPGETGIAERDARRVMSAKRRPLTPPASAAARPAPPPRR